VLECLACAQFQEQAIIKVNVRQNLPRAKQKMLNVAQELTQKTQNSVQIPNDF
jgi:hypothetical protein